MTEHTKTYFARCVSAEIRSRLAVDRGLNQLLLGRILGRSQNYVSERVRDVKPFTLDDMGMFLAYFGERGDDFVNACERHGDVVENEMDALGIWEGGESRVDRLRVTQDADVAVGPPESPVPGSAPQPRSRSGRGSR